MEMLKISFFLFIFILDKCSTNTYLHICVSNSRVCFLFLPSTCNMITSQLETFLTTSSEFSKNLLIRARSIYRGINIHPHPYETCKANRAAGGVIQVSKIVTLRCINLRSARRVNCVVYISTSIPFYILLLGLFY